MPCSHEHRALDLVLHGVSVRYEVLPDRKISTEGAVDYTSIAVSRTIMRDEPGRTPLHNRESRCAASRSRELLPRAGREASPVSLRRTSLQRTAPRNPLTHTRAIAAHALLVDPVHDVLLVMESSLLQDATVGFFQASM